MSFITGTSGELLYASVATGTQLNTFTTEDSLQKTLAPVIIPAGFFYNPSAVGRSISVRAYGRWGSTTSGPTMVITARLLTSTTWSAGGISLASSASVAMAASQTLAPWMLDLDIVCRAVSVGGASTLATMGYVRSPKGFASPFMATIPDNNTAFTITTLDNSTTYYFFLSCTCGTSNAANLVQLEMLKVYGEN